ncbi:MAG TPA: GWxTD domain-containing protein [Thermoanaerobaculia bacterium]|nr:GWxTD domain-containing protein [Thermoanaerobaculia bacterium]
MKSFLLAVLTLSVALTLTAQTKPREFGNGPARWLMTADEQKAWRNVKTDDEAIDFIDLFFARRDPTPGTPRNEFRQEYENRVAYAEREFKEGSTRGSLTERGRVIVVLGFPTEMGNKMQSRTAEFTTVQGFEPGDPTGGRTMAAKDTWTYTHEASEKFGMPKIEVVFIFDRLGERARRDPQRTDFTSALPGAIKSYIVSPDLKTVPEWASSRASRLGVAPQDHIETVVTVEKVRKGQVIVDAPRPVALPAGAGKLTLVSDPAVLQPQSGGDPFGALASLASFKRSQDLGWAAEYCSGEIAENPPSVKVQIQLVGKDGTSTSDPEEFVPDSIKASPGCYLLRGSVPLTDIDPGPHTLRVSITSGPGPSKYNLTREFQVE